MWALHLQRVWTPFIILLTVIVGHNQAEQRREPLQQCVVNTRGCLPSTTTLSSHLFGKLTQRLEQVQLDLAIIESELACSTQSRLLNETRSAVALLRSAEFGELLGASCSMSGVTLDRYCCHQQQPPCDCHPLQRQCLGPGGLAFYAQRWREVVDNLRTSLRILLSQSSCTLPHSSTLLSKLHSARDLSPWMGCGGGGQCSPVNQSPSPQSHPPPIYNKLIQATANLRLNWPTTTKAAAPTPDHSVHDDFGGSGAGQNDQELGSGGGLHDDQITDDEDLLQPEFGSGEESTEGPGRVTTTTRRPVAKAAGVSLKAELLTLLFMMLRCL